MAVVKKILTTPPLRVAIFAFISGNVTPNHALAVCKCSNDSLIYGYWLLYPVRFIKKPVKGFLDYIKLILVVFWAANGVFRALDFAYTLFFQVIIAMSFSLWIILEGTAYFLDEDRKAKNSKSQMWWNLTMVIGTLAIIAGSLLNLLGWSFAIPMMIIGVASIIAFIYKRRHYAYPVKK